MNKTNLQMAGLLAFSSLVFLAVAIFLTYTNPDNFWTRSANSKCKSLKREVAGQVVDVYSEVFKDILFTGYVGSTRKIIVRFDDGTTKTFNSNTLVIGDSYSQVIIENVCD